jgi:prenylcysteine oxidase/farnesylcysteine lyase
MSLFCLIFCRVLMAWVPFLGRFFPGHAASTTGPEDRDLPAARVAVIGAGVGGCFAANFLRELGGQKLEIHVWNKKDSHVGGRTATTEFAGHTFETGAAIMHTSNKYLVDATNKYGKQLLIP